MTLLVDVNMLINKILHLNEKIRHFLSCHLMKKTKLSWEINRLHWQKNRLIFIEWVQKKTISKNILVKISKIVKIDWILIKYWSKPKFQTLCLLDMMHCLYDKKVPGAICRIPFEKRLFNCIFFINEKSGCIYCGSEKHLNEPIWWDEFEKVFKILKTIRINKILKKACIVYNRLFELMIRKKIIGINFKIFWSSILLFFVENSISIRINDFSGCCRRFANLTKKPIKVQFIDSLFFFVK